MLHLVNKYDFPIKLLELEITETTDSEGVSDVVQKMKDAGFTMLMDDFGSGYSSLNMLQKTQFDVLKIDRGFLSEFMESSRGRKIISHTISMSRDIGLDIIAGGRGNSGAGFVPERLRLRFGAGVLLLQADNPGRIRQNACRGQQINKPGQFSCPGFAIIGPRSGAPGTGFIIRRTA